MKACQKFITRLLVVITPLIVVACEGVGSPISTTGGQANQQQGDAANLVPPNVLNIPGIPIPNGVLVSLDNTVIVGADQIWTGQVVMTSDTYQPIQLVEYMRKNMPKHGWDETAIVRSKRTSITYAGNQRFATVRIQPLNGGTEIDIVVSPIGKLQLTLPSNQSDLLAPSNPIQQNADGFTPQNRNPQPQPAVINSVIPTVIPQG